MKKRLFIACTFFLLLGAGYQFLVSKPVASDLLVDKQRLEIDEVYLKVFNNFSILDLESQYALTRASGAGIEVRRDPFRISDVQPDRPAGVRRAVGSSSHAARLNLTGILWDETSPMAIINDRIVKAGSNVGEFKVARILRRKVFLRSGQKSMTLQLPQMEANIH